MCLESWLASDCFGCCMKLIKLTRRRRSSAAPKLHRFGPQDRFRTVAEETRTASCQMKTDGPFVCSGGTFRWVCGVSWMP